MNATEGQENSKSKEEECMATANWGRFPRKPLHCFHDNGTRTAQNAETMRSMSNERGLLLKSSNFDIEQQTPMVSVKAQMDVYTSVK